MKETPQHAPLIPFLIMADPKGKADTVYKLMWRYAVPRKGEEIHLLDQTKAFQVARVIHDFGGPTTFGMHAVVIDVTAEVATLLKEYGWEEMGGDVARETNRLWPCEDDEES